MVIGKTTRQLATKHEWFAWRPVIIEDGRMVWLRTIMRSINGTNIYYRLKEGD